MPDIKKIKLGDTTYNICDANAVHTVKQDGITGATVNRFGTCGTAAATAAKTVSVTTGTFSLEAGARVSVKFTYANTASTPTLNVAGKGAKNIFHKGAQITSGSNKALLAGICDFVYDGTQWHLVGNYIDTNTTYSVATTSANGLMSKEDKAHHDTMWNVWSADGTDETLVNKVEEVLTVFENFPEADNLVGVLSGKSNVGHTHGTSTQNVAPSGHTHTVTVSGATGNNSGSAVKAVTGYASFSGGSGSLEAYDAATSGTKKVSNGTRIPVVTSVTHTAASLGTASTGTVSISGGSYSGTTRYMKVSTTAADTGTVGISGGSGSLEAYDAATNGTKKVSNGTRVQYIHSLSKGGYTPAGSVTLTAGTAPSMNFNTGTNTDTPYISALTNGSYTPAGSVSLTNGTAPSMGAATTKYLSASASGTAVGANGTGDCAPNNHTHTVTVSGTSGANSGTAVKAVTGYANFSGGSLTGTKTFNTDAIKSIGGTKNYGFSASTSNVMYSPTVSNGVLSWSVANASTQDAHTGTAASTGTVGFTAASLGTATTEDVAPSGHTHAYGSTTALTTNANSGTKVTALTGVKVTAQPTISLTANTSSATGRITYVESQGTFSAGTTPKSSASFSGTATTALVTSGTTKYMKFSAGTTPKSSASFTGTNSTAVVTGGTTYYLAHGHTAASLTGTKTFNTNGVKAVSLSASTTSTDGPAYTESISGSTPSLGGTKTFVTGYNSFSGGSITPTTYYLAHNHTSASLGTASTTDVAPSGHTHSYGSSTTLTTSANNGNAVKAVTVVDAATE